MGREQVINEIRRWYSSAGDECNELLCDKGYTKLKNNHFAFGEIPLCWKAKDSWGCPFDKDIEEGYTWVCLTGFVMAMVSLGLSVTSIIRDLLMVIIVKWIQYLTVFSLAHGIILVSILVKKQI